MDGIGQTLQGFMIRIPAILMAITFHEFAHARVALAFGDDTAEREGRVSLNPMVHLDPVGTIGLIFGFFGWGRPVPVNPSRMTHPRGELLVSAAGPMSNFAMALMAALLMHVLPYSVLSLVNGYVWSLLAMLVTLNLVLCFFNFLPLFPLDGSHIAQDLLPHDKAEEFRRFNQQYGMPILFSLIMLGLFTGVSPLWEVIGIPVGFFTRLLMPS